ALGAAAATTEGTRRLLELIRDAEGWVGDAVAGALGSLGAAAATPEVIRRLLELTRDADQDEEVRAEAARALGRMMAEGVRCFKVPGWKRPFRGKWVARRLEE